MTTQLLLLEIQTQYFYDMCITRYTDFRPNLMDHNKRTLDDYPLLSSFCNDGIFEIFINAFIMFDNVCKFSYFYIPTTKKHEITKHKILLAW